MLSSLAIARARMLILIALPFASALAVSLPGCGEDDPAAPKPLPNLAAADTAFVTLHILGAVEYTGDEIFLQWSSIGTRPTGGEYDADNAIFHGDQTVTTDVTMSHDVVHLEFDTRSGGIDSLYCSSSYSYPTGGRGESLTAHDIPLSTYEMVDGQMEAVWRIEGVMTCTVIDTATYNRSAGSATLLTWSCAGDEVPYIEIRLKN